ncbi:unnamed protein product [Parnassius mnemosyne]|uniref:Uncharacterized protein n=1 Tax=Parnassius mnemosyne TaxID=213953 RepID=A0AAV1L458_9NEOP
MEDEGTYSKKTLEECSYRYLQQLAKSMKLPCNVKKIYLIELIWAKKFSSASEVKSIVQRVKLEREQHSMAQVRKRSNKAKLKNAEIYSLSKRTPSPPITATPRRPGNMLLHCSPDLGQTVIKYKPKQSLSHIPHRTYPSPKAPNGSDRVLRSFNLKRLNKNSGILNINDTVVGMIKTQQRINPKETRIEIVSREGNYPKFNVTAKCLVKKHRPSILSSSTLSAVKTCESRQLVPVYNGNTSPPAKRQRSISGIYPLVHEETTNRCDYLQSVGLRGRDGKMARIHALIQRRSTFTENYDILNMRTPEINLQDVINCKIDAQNLASTNLMEFVLADTNINNNFLQLPYPTNLDNQENVAQNLELLNNKQNVIEKDVSDDMHSVYYHKKIRAEQVRCNQFLGNREQIVENQTLPKINEVFTKFKDVTQPLHVQVSNESDRILNNPVYVPRNNTNTWMLENIYNIRSQFLINQPLLPVATTSSTKCVYSTPILTSAAAQPTSTVVSSERYSSLEADSRYRNYSDDNIPRLSEFLRFPQQNAHGNDYAYNEELNTSASSMDTSQSQGLGACVTIPEMVEDALEIISQDGDYMERIGMDIRVQCILCSWAGPKIMLEYHIKKEHSSQIYKQYKNEWNITFTLGSLVQCQLWLSQVIEYDSVLYVLSAKYEDPDCFMASLSILTTEESIHKVGSITLYNKVSGEPYLWEGVIQPLPSNLPYYNDLHCLKLELSRLDLLPNSANLKLLNRELVINSPNKVVVGQPELNDIHIILFIKILD